MTNNKKNKSEEQERIEFGYWKQFNKHPYNAPINEHYMVTPDDMFSIEMMAQPEDAVPVYNVGEMNLYHVMRNPAIHIRTYVKVIATKRYRNYDGDEDGSTFLREEILAVYRDGRFVGFAFSHVDECDSKSFFIDFDIKYFYGYDYDKGIKNIIMPEEYAILEMAKYLTEYSLAELLERGVNTIDVLKFVMNEVKNK